jgi:hypothetical protein
MTCWKLEIEPVAVVIVNVAEPLSDPELAVILLVPCATPVASPLLAIVARDGADDTHVNVLVRFCVVPLLYSPVAVNCCKLPTGTEVAVGVTEIDVSTGAVTVKGAEPLIIPEVAVMVTVP